MSSGSYVFGATSRMELMIRFVTWALQLHRPPLPEEIAERFGVSYATAYRWRNTFCDATGQPIPQSRTLGKPFGEAVLPASFRPDYPRVRPHRKGHQE